MKTYVLITGVVFGLLTAAHIWRVVEEGTQLLRNPFWGLITAAAAALSLWAFRLLWNARRPAA